MWKKCLPLQTDNQSSILGTQWCASVIPALLGRDRGSGDKRIGQRLADELASPEKVVQDTKQWRHACQREQTSKTCLLACTGSLSFLSFKQIIKEIKEKAEFIKPEMDKVWKILRYSKTFELVRILCWGLSHITIDCSSVDQGSQRWWRKDRGRTRDPEVAELLIVHGTWLTLAQLRLWCTGSSHQNRRPCRVQHGREKSQAWDLCINCKAPAAYINVALNF